MGDLKGLTPAKLSGLSAGQTVQVRGRGPCLADGAHTVCRGAAGGLYLPCSFGQHYLDILTLDDGDTLAGIYTGEPETEPRVEADLAAWLDAAGDPGGAPPETVDAIEAVLIERRNQVFFKAYTPSHDDATYLKEGRLMELAGAAAYLILEPQLPLHAFQHLCPDWASALKVGSPRENYVRAAALLVAQIELLDRQAQREGV